MFNCADHPFGLEGLYGWLPTAITMIVALFVAGGAWLLLRRPITGPALFFNTYVYVNATLSIVLALSAWDCRSSPGQIRFISLADAPVALLFSFFLHFPQRILTIPPTLCLAACGYSRAAFYISLAADLAIVALYVAALFLN